MKTAYYTFITWEDRTMAAGFDGTSSTRQTAMVRQPEARPRPAGGDNVVDLSAWRTAEPNRQWADPQDEPDLDGEERDAAEPALPQDRPRRDHRRAMLIAELASTLCVAAVAAVLILRVLTF